jgi:catechol-2,3-dioxygenase
MLNSPDRPSAVPPRGVNHLVLNVSDLERSHRFWTDIMGFHQVGQLEPKPDAQRSPQMRFYAGSGGNHHDLALAQVAGPTRADADAEPMAGSRPGLNHVAIEYPDRDTWQAQLRFLQAAGIGFRGRVNHGMSHSVYIQDPDGHGIEVLYNLPPEQWTHNLNAALNYVHALPRDGLEALADPESPVFR